jgi:deoxyribodipyrimidine photolyase-related protein
MSVTVWILGDQLLRKHPALIAAEQQFNREPLVILMIESETRVRRLPYQRKKIVLLFSAMRHYAEQLCSSGFQVDYRIAPRTDIAIKQHLQSHQPEIIYTMAASEFGGRKFQEDLEHHFNIPVTVLPNTQFLTGRFNPYPDPLPDKRYVQELFYRKIRKHFNLLMKTEDGPIGGRWNYDKDNRRSLPKVEQPSQPISFAPDQITSAVMEEVAQKYPGVGQVAGFDLAVTHEQADQAALDFFDQRLPKFGPYEDAMSSASDTIYHSRLSPYLNLGLLDPLTLAQEAQNRFHDGHAPINSVEGFIRQIIGWREFIYWQYWRLMPDIAESNYWGANRPLPQMFWDGETKMNCLQHVILRALQTGYTHHIERLMIISNFCVLSGINPLAVNDWFLSSFIDAYEWVMLPNVFGMGLNADGGLIATKPYIASANYVQKMSDYCQSCAFDRKSRTGEQACPFNFLYWNFMIRHETTLRLNPRMSRSLLGLRHLDQEQRQLVKESATQFLDRLK